MRRALTILALALSLPSAALANPPKEKEPKTDVGQYVELQPLGLPIVSNGKLVNYVFVSVRLNLASSANAQKLREKEPYFRDALVRAAHRTPFNSATDLQSVDVGKLQAAVMRDAATIAGPGQVRSVAVTSQAPRQHVRLPQAQ